MSADGAGEGRLARRIADLILANGPITIADYMALALGDPNDGYYITRDPLGRGGDFVTAPEISQMFGEIAGIWLVEAWRALGHPLPVRLVELGPGRGTLMADILRVVARLAPPLASGLSLHLVETSPALRARQAATLAPSRIAPHWHAAFAEVPEGPILLVANEFFDALPIRQFVRTDGAWRERVVGLGEDGRLAFGLGPGTLVGDAPAQLVRNAPEGAVIEVSPASTAIMTAIAERIATVGGAALAIDYGHAETAFGDTFQAVQAHAFADPLAEPGSADLTAHVDFGALARAARAAGAGVLGPITQGDFLLTMGLLERAGRLGAPLDEPGREAIRAAVERLAGPQQMGTLFKAMAVVPVGVALPPFPG